jgi:dethiobiotin synthetase
MNYFVTAIGTDSGKTLISAIVTEALQADYWKPMQSGLTPRDAETVESLLTNDHTVVHPEQFLFNTPVSPHVAAKIDGIEVNINEIEFPFTENNVVIEGAGGLLVPINYKGDFIADLIPYFNAEIILVSNNYLGSINHTLLTINEIKRRNLKVKGIIFNGPTNEETENYILNYSQFRCLLKVKQHEEINQEIVKKYAIELMANWRTQEEWDAL